MFNADMLGYQIPTEPITLGFKDKYVSHTLTESIRTIIGNYLPNLPTAYSSSCCSDYLPFFEEGYLSVGFFENAIAAASYPHYHTSTDLLQYINTDQLRLESQALCVAALTYAVPVYSDGNSTRN